MAAREIEESDLLSLQHISSVVDAVMKQPATRTQFLQLAKRANPGLSIPEVDAAAPVTLLAGSAIVLTVLLVDGTEYEIFVRERP